jgi:hypothetical protein
MISIPGNVTRVHDNEDLLRKLAAKHRLPVMHWDNAYPADGGLMSYASSFEDLRRRAAGYVDPLLRGAKVSAGAFSNCGPRCTRQVSTLQEQGRLLGEEQTRPVTAVSR